METHDTLGLLIWSICVPSLATVLLLFLQRLNFLWTRPGLRHSLWLAILVGSVVPPMLPLPVLPKAPEIEGSIRVADNISPPFVSIDSMPTTNASTAGVATHGPRMPNTNLLHSDQPATSTEVSTTRLLWLAAFGSLMVSLALFTASLRSLLRYRRMTGLLSTDVAADKVCEELAGTFGASKRPRVCIASHIESPSLLAATRPAVIVLPRSVCDSSTESQVQQIIGHELSHYVRFDHWSGLVASVVTYLFWWNPLLWMARRQMLEAAEHCCDAMVIDRLSCSRKSYAELLLKVIDTTCHPQAKIPLVVTMSSHSRWAPARFELIGNPRVRSRTTRIQQFIAVTLIASMAWVPIHSQGPPSPTKEDRSTSSDDSSRQPWIGSWRTKCTNDGETFEGEIVFGNDTSTDQGKGKAKFSSDQPWEFFRYQVETQRKQLRHPTTRITMDFRVNGTGGPYRVVGRFRQTDDGNAIVVLEPSDNTNGIRAIHLFPTKKSPQHRSLEDEPETTDEPVAHQIEPDSRVAMNDAFADYPPVVDSSSQQPLEEMVTKRRMNLFFQLHSEVQVNDIVRVTVAPKIDATADQSPGPPYRRVTSQQRAKILEVHSQVGCNADVTLVFAKPYRCVPEATAHAFVEHGVHFDESTRRAGDTSELSGRWKLMSIERADGFDHVPSGDIEAEATGDTWKVFVDGEYRSTKLISADPFQAPKQFTLIQSHRGTGEPVIHRGVYRISEDQLEIFFGFSLDERPAAFDLTDLGRMVPFEVKQLWQRVNPNHD
ncbi:MAG: M56 family metallopeptidase [Planctomycetota bacterium]